jgi:hypothetical protein
MNRTARLARYARQSATPARKAAKKAKTKTARAPKSLTGAPSRVQVPGVGVFHRTAAPSAVQQVAEKTMELYRQYKSGYKWFLEALDDEVGSAAFRNELPRGLDSVIAVDIKRKTNPELADQFKRAVQPYLRDTAALTEALATELQSLVEGFEAGRFASVEKKTMRNRRKTADSEPLVWPVFRSEEDRENEEVANAFLLSGGELETTPWAGYKYWYEGAPDYAEEIDTFDGEYRTVLIMGGGYLPYPDKEIAVDNQVWKLVADYGNSGEADCWICGAGTGDYWEENFWEAYDREPGPEDSCGLCETKHKDMPGYVYVGEGYEAVYKLVEEDYEDEDLY